jgi:hypothetical protein
MSVAADVLDVALALSESERAEIARRLLLSLETPGLRKSTPDGTDLNAGKRLPQTGLRHWPEFESSCSYKAKTELLEITRRLSAGILSVEVESNVPPHFSILGVNR